MDTEAIMDNDAKTNILNIRFKHSLDTQINERTIYSSLNWIGDVGGFMGVILSIGGYFMKYFSTNFLLNYLYNSVYKPDKTLDIKTAIVEQIRALFRFKSKLMQKRSKGIQRIERELDIVNFIRSQLFTKSLFANLV